MLLILHYNVHFPVNFTAGVCSAFLLYNVYKIYTQYTVLYRTVQCTVPNSVDCTLQSLLHSTHYYRSILSCSTVQSYLYHLIVANTCLHHHYRAGLDCLVFNFEEK